MKTWTVVRWQKEYMEVEAETKEEALDNCENPYHVQVTKVTCKEKD